MRAICYNIYMCRGWPQQEEASKEVRNIVTPDLYAEALGKYNPDVITFSEVPSDSIVQAIAEPLGMQVVLFDSPEKAYGALLTRFEVLESKNCPLCCGERPEELFTRYWGRAVLDTGEEELVVHSAHLFPNAQSSMHSKEVGEVIKVTQDDMESGRSVLLQGDLNHEPEDRAYERWRETGLVDTFAAAGTGPGETCGDVKRDPQKDRLDQRIDYIFACGPIVQHLRECRILSDPPFRVGPSASKSWALSDHSPVMATFD